MTATNQTTYAGMARPGRAWNGAASQAWHGWDWLGSATQKPDDCSGV